MSNVLTDFFERFASVANTRISARSVTDFMQQTSAGSAMSGLGNNPQSGVGTLRRDKGRLSSSITGADFRGNREAIYNVNISDDGVEITKGSETPYAGVHEHGFSGSVNVPAHTRRITQAFGRQIEPQDVNVMSYTKSVMIPARPYLLPAIEAEKRYLFNWIRDNFEDTLREGIQV